ncbi:uncharacterized protein LOC135210852 isoform X4 [Macrobrachium nipponense]|uniref:uncharacterized protein LOC135210852 isoform X4 n=1 Tax=Macrobrachium nipponense TaxID=159736 RepID=UPI0030C833AF
MRLVDLVSVSQLTLNPSKFDLSADESEACTPTLLSPVSSPSPSSTKAFKGTRNVRSGNSGKLSRENSDEIFEPNEGRRKRHHIWDTIRTSPRLTPSKCSSNCRHGYRNRIYSTDEESDVNSSYPASPVKHPLLNRQHSQGAVSYKSTVKEQYNNNSGNFSDEMSSKELDKCHLSNPEENRETCISPSDSEESNDCGRYAECQESSYCQPKKAPSSKMKNKTVRTKDKKCREVSDDTVKCIIGNDEKSPDVHSGAKPKIRKVKDLGTGIIAANSLSRRVTNSGKVIRKKSITTTTNPQVDGKEAKQNGNYLLERQSLKTRGNGSKKQNSIAVAKKNSLWNNVKNNPSVVSGKAEGKLQTSLHSDSDKSDGLTDVKDSKSEGWDVIKKNVTSRKRIKSKTGINTNNSSKVPAICEMNKQKANQSCPDDSTTIFKSNRLNQRRGSLQISGSSKNRSPSSDRHFNHQRSKSNGRRNSLHGQETPCSMRNDFSHSRSSTNILSSPGSSCSSRTDLHSSSRRNSLHSLQGSRCSSRTDFSSNSRRNSMHSLPGSRCSTRSDPNFLYVNENLRTISSLSSRSGNSNCHGSKSDVSETSPVPGNSWNPYWNSKIVVAAKPLKNLESARALRKRKTHTARRSSIMTKGLKEECSEYDTSDDCSSNKIGELTVDNVQSTEVFRSRSGYMRQGRRHISGSINSLPGYRESASNSFERDSAIGSMNSLGKEKSYDGDHLSGSLRSLDSWEYPTVNLNRGSYNESIKSLDEFRSSSRCNVASKKGFCSLIDIKDYMKGNMHNLKEEDSSYNCTYPYNGSKNYGSTPQHIGKLTGRKNCRENSTGCSSWGSLPKLSRGLESVQQCIEDKATRWKPEFKANSTLNDDNVKERASQGWESIRRKIMVKDWGREGKKAANSFRSGGGEGESEWFASNEDAEANVSSKTLRVEIPRSRSLSSRRAPKFSELFGGPDGSQRRAARSTYTSEDLRPSEKRSKSLGRNRSKARSHESWNSRDIDILKEKQKLQVAILKSIQDSGHSDSEDDKSPVEGLESGLGSSFDESSDSNLPVQPEESQSSHPEKVFAAITSYLMTVDQNETDEEIDNFNREADGFDPEDLMLLTDHEDNLTWEDLIVCYNMSPVHVPKSKNSEDKEACDGTVSDLAVPDIQDISESQQEELDMLLESDGDYDSLSLITDHKSSNVTEGLNADEKEVSSSNPARFTRSEAFQTDAKVQQNRDLMNESEKDNADTIHQKKLQSPMSIPVNTLGVNAVAKDTIDSVHQGSAQITLESDDSDASNSISHKPENVLVGQVKEISAEPSSPGNSALKKEIAGNSVTDTRSQEGKDETQMSDAAVENQRGRTRANEKRSVPESRERSVSCSENIRAFLITKPCSEDSSNTDNVEIEGKDSSKYHVVSVGAIQERADPVSSCSQEKGKEAKKKQAKLKENATKKSAKNSMLESFLSMFCTTPVTVEGIAPESESHDTDPEPLPPPIPPHAVDPEIMTADEAERLLSAKESQSILSDEEAQEVVLLLSPPNEDSSKILPPPPPPIPPHHGEGLSSVPPHYDIPPAVPPHYADITPPVPPHFGPNVDEFDARIASHFDATLASPLSPEDEPSEADSSEETGDICQVSRVKEVLVEDGVHYLEDGHFWVEVPGLPEDDDEEDMDPTLPFHPHTKLSFSKEPIQVFSTYSVTEYDRKNDEVDPVAASAEYELEKRVEKMDLFPVEIIKGEGGLGLSIIGMGVGADAGVEKLGIFVKTITAGGATERDGRIQVNDQIIEVDGKSLVGVTQVFAASVLKNTSGRVHFLIGREKDPENSEVALLIKQSLQADREREERRRALGGPDYDPHTGNGLFDPMSSPSEENSRSEEVPQNYSSYLEGGSSPTSPDAVSPPIESFDLEGDTSDTSPDNDAAILKLRLKEVQYKNAVAEAEINKLKMTLLEMEKIVTENVQYSSQLNEAQVKVVELDEKLQSKLSEVSTYQDMLEQSQGQYIILEKKYYKAKKIIKEYQGRERDFLHREEYHITQLEEKDSHYNALVKALKDRVINLEEELKNAQKKAGLPVEVPSDLSVQPAYLDLQQSAQSALAKQPPRKPSLSTFDPEISDTETSDNGASEGDKANTVERKLPVKEELDEAVPPHELLDVSASRAKGELAARGGLANRHLPSLKKTTSMSSAGSQDQSLDDSSLDDDLPEAQKHAAAGETSQDTQMDQGSRRSAEPQEISFPQSPVHQPQSPLQPAISSPQILQNSSFNSSSNQAKSTQPPSYSQATMGNISYLGSPPPPYQPPPTQFGIPRQPLAPSDPSTGLPPRSLSGAVDTHVFESRSESRPEIPYRHPPPVARVLPVNRAEISESASLAAHLANRTPQQLSLAEQLKALLAEREVQGEVSQKNEREASPSKRSPTSLMEDVRQAVLQADVSSSVPTPHYKPYMGKKPVISAPINLSSTAHVVATGQIVQQVNSPNRSQSAVYSIGGRDSIRDSNTGSQSPKLGRSSIHASPLSGVSPNPSGVVLLSQRPIDSSLPIQKLVPGVDGSSGDISSGPASLGSGDEGSGASLGSQTSLSHMHMPADRSKRAHMWQTAPVIDWTKEQVSQWLVVQGLESCVSRFQEIGMTGPRLLNLDIRDLKSLGVPPDEKSKLKRKVKELRLAVEKERKQAEKEKKERERLQKKAEKLAEKAEKKKK